MAEGSPRIFVNFRVRNIIVDVWFWLYNQIHVGHGFADEFLKVFIMTSPFLVFPDSHVPFLRWFFVEININFCICGYIIVYEELTYN
jgi:hypothetical protein